MKRLTIVVTGASRGIGRHCAQSLYQKGYRVVGLARTVPNDVDFEVRECDVSDANAVSASMSDLRRDETVFGLINAAGAASMNLAMTTPVRTVQSVIATNLLGTIYCCQSVAPALVRARRGRIINFSTIAVALGLKGESVYVASKAGIEGFTKSFAREMADFGVTVNAIAPGPVSTDLIAKVPPRDIEQIVARQIIPRMAVKEDILDIIYMLLSEQASMLTGEVLHVGGV
jgi:3-oxoacyl-[acyl-carrier protein] reductase